MSKKAIWTVVIIIIILLGLAFLMGGDQVGVENASVEVSDQMPGDRVVVDSVTIPQEGGFVAVRNSEGEVVGSTTYYEAGTYTSIGVVLEEETQEGMTYSITIYTDSNGDGVFDATVDSEVTVENGQFVVTSSSDEDDDNATTTEDDNATTTEVEGEAEVEAESNL